MPRPSKKRAKAKSNKAKTKKKSKSLLAGLLRLVLIMTLLGAIGFLAFCTFYYLRALTFDMALVKNMPERTTVLDRNGAQLGKIHGQNRTIVPFEDISEYFLMSIIAREDARFYEHSGIDYRGLARATMRNIKDRGMTQGASTITMQLSRNSFDLSQGKEWYHELDRKILEIFVAKRIEAKYEKTEILQHYCNRIFWGHSMLGIEAASQAYLQKPAKKLTLSEAAMLAGIVRGPNAFSPFRSIKLATRERDTVLDRLVYYQYITPEDAKKAKSEPLRIRPKKSRTKGQSYAMEAISKELSYHLAKHNIKLGGLVIHTTIDKGLQSVAEQSINKRLSKIENLSGYKHQTRAQFQRSSSNKAPAYLQGALVCIDNNTGGIVATVGGRSANESSFNRAMYARRQIGSIFKPFVYQAAYDKGLRPSTLIDDSRLKPGDVDHAANNWNPGNSDGKFKGLVKTRDALLKSRNTSSVRVGDYATIEHVTRAAEIAGFELFQWQKQFDGKTPKTATSYLGAWEASPEEVARAYSIFPNKGTYKHPYIITKIVNRDGVIVIDNTAGGVQIAERPLSQGATYEVSKILEDINITGTGSSLRRTHGFTAPSAGKTGTTDDYKDAWYAGYTSSLTCAVWVGLDTPKKIISQGYGSRLALPIWADLMKAASKKTEFSANPLHKKPKSTAVMMCERSARRATTNCQKHGSSYEDLVTNDLFHVINQKCTIHDNSTGNKPSRAKEDNPVTNAVSGFFKRLLGGEKKREPISSPPQRAIIVEPNTPSNTPRAKKNIPRAIIVEEPVRKPIRTTPPRAIVVEEPRRIPPKATIVKPPPRAIIVEEPRSTPPRAIIVD